VDILGYVIGYIFQELARMSRKPLTKQELFIIWSISSVATGEVVSLWIFQQNFYFRSLSPITWSFFAQDGTPLPLAISDWVAPSPSSAVILLRTFWHPDWLVPVIVFILGWVMAKIAHMMLGILNYQIYAVEEKLPFPLQVIGADLIVNLTDREESKVKVMTISALCSAVFSFIMYFPAMAFGITGLPIPWLDLNAAVERVLPGASFGIATNPSVFATALMLPLNITISMFIGSFLFYFVGNNLLVRWGIFTEWRPGMSVALAWQRSVLAFWAFPQIGLTLAGALIPILFHANLITRAFRNLRKITGFSSEAGVLPLKIVVPVYLICTISCFLLIVSLTDFPWYLLAILVFGWSFFSSLILTNAIGLTGYVVDVPYVNEAVFLMSGYKNVNIWFAPLMITQGTGGWFAATYKLCELTGTKITSLITAHLIIASIAFVLSFIYLQLFWTMAPIPSAIYPATSAFWPISVVTRSLWMTGSLFSVVSIQLILGSFVLGAIIESVSTFLHLPFSTMAMAVGGLTALPVAVTFLIGGIVAKILSRIFGEEWWRAYRASAAAGIFLGQSAIVVIAVGVNMVTKSIWPLPY
jgi:hypothetical protein